VSRDVSETPDIPPLPTRPTEGHKGTFGTVTVFGGCCAGDARMVGAPCLAALAALRAGAGLAVLAVPDPIADAALTIAPTATAWPVPVDAAGEIVPAEAARLLAEAAGKPGCLVVGPGLGRSPAARALALQAVLQEDAPVVLDADALNALAAVPELQRDMRASAVLTPHPGEYGRLARALGLEEDPASAAGRADAAQRLAAFLGVVVVLKGARTVVADAARVWTSDAELPQLAAGGTGDVLAGVIAGLVSQHSRSAGLFDCAAHAVAAHADAARAWGAATGASGGMLATDLLGRLPAAVETRRLP